MRQRRRAEETSRDGSRSLSGWSAGRAKEAGVAGYGRLRLITANNRL